MGLKDFLQGEWLGHPLHPAIVHVPMGLWPAALVLDVLSWTGRGGNLVVQMSFFAIAVGTVVAISAIAPGFADWSGIKREKPAWKLGLFHLILNLAATAVWTVNLFVRWPEFQREPQVGFLPLLLSLLGTLLLGIGAWLGKRMVFDQGTSVGRHSKSELRKRAERGRAALPEE